MFFWHGIIFIIIPCHHCLNSHLFHLGAFNHYRELSALLPVIVIKKLIINFLKNVLWVPISYRLNSKLFSLIVKTIHVPFHAHIFPD